MKITTKEKLNDKARKMIDLIYDEVCSGGEETLTASFIDKKSGLKYKLTVGINVTDPKSAISAEGPVVDLSQFEENNGS